MGISDDIKPKKTYRYVEKKEETPIIVSHSSKSKETHEVKEHHESHHAKHNHNFSDSYEDKELLEDNFFNGKEEPADQLPAKKTVHRRSFHFARKIMWLIVFIILGFVIYKNSDLLKKELLKNLSEDVGQTDENITYVNVEKENPSVKEISEESTSTESSTEPTQTNTTTSEESAVDKASISLEVLNGNGIRGSADKVANLLTTSGYSVKKVANAKNFGYTSTNIYYKTGKEKEATGIKTILNNSYKCETTLSDTLTAGYDIVVVVGKN